MSQSSDALTPPAGVSADEFSRLLAQGRARRGLSVDDVMAVLKHVELSEDVIDGVRQRLSDEGIHLDEAEVELNGADLLPPDEPAAPPAGFTNPLPAPPAAVGPGVAFLPQPPFPPAAPGGPRPAGRGAGAGTPRRAPRPPEALEGGW